MKERKFLFVVSFPLILSLIFPPFTFAFPNTHLKTPAAARDAGIRNALRQDLAKDGSVRTLQVGELTLKAETIPDLLDLQIERYGIRTYLVVPTAEGYREISFREVGEGALRVAKALFSHGVRQGDRVGFLSPNRPDFGISTYGVLELGGANVPMPFGAPLPVLKHMVSNSDTTYLVVAAPFLEKARVLKAEAPNIQKIFVLDNVPGLKEDEISLAAWKEETPVALPDIEISPEDLALILYTSGSTKLPKGVPLTHQNLLYNMEASRLAWERSFTDKDMTLGWLPFFHVMGLPHELWKNMYVGARYAFPRLKPGPPTPDQLVASLKESGATVLYTAPYMLEGFKAMAEGEVWEAFVGGQRIVMRFEKDPSVLETLRKLKFIMSGGVALTEPLGDYFQRNGINVVQGEGMSDVGGAIFLSDPAERDPHTLRLIPGMNARFIPVEGVDGAELVLGHSPTTTAGYLKNPEETAEAFREDGFHTGDLFREVRPGRYVFAGRADDVDKTSKAEKINKLDIERDLEKSRVIQRAAVIVSQRPRPAVIIKPDYTALRGKQWMEIEQAVWEVVDQVNAGLPKFSQIRRDHVILLAPHEGFPLSPKQSLIRPQVEKMYADRIEAVYTGDARRVEAQERRRALVQRVRQRTRGYQDVVKRTGERDLAFALLEEARRAKRTVIRGERMNIAEAVAVGRGGVPIQITTSRSVRERVQASVDRLRGALDEGTHIYGVTTYFGASADIDIRSTQLKELQHELIRFENMGVGGHLPREVVRAAMAARLNHNVRGDSAVRLSVLQAIERLLNRNVTPNIPDTGTITASGDLAPNAHVVGVLVGRHDATASDPEGKTISAKEALERGGLEPVTLEPKEGLALINGTNFAVGQSALVLHDAHLLALLAEAATALSAEAAQGTTQDFAAFVHERRGDPEQIEVAQNIRELLAGSQLVRHELEGQPKGEASAHAPGEEIQTHYHHRTAAQWLGPQNRTLIDATEVIDRELNASTDNPLIDPETGNIYQGGNFQGANVARAMDSTRLALAKIAQLIHRQYSEVTNKFYSKGLPDNLAGANISERSDVGFKGVEIGMSGWLAKINFLANPVTTHVQSAEGHNQTINSLGFLSAQVTQDALTVLQIMLAHHLYAAVQAIDLRNIELAYRQATAEAIAQTVDATLSKAVKNPAEVSERAKTHLTGQAKGVRPFHYAYTVETEYQPLFEKLAEGIDQILTGEGVQLVDDPQAVAQYRTLFKKTLAEKLRTVLPQARERALQQGAGHLLGNTRPIYEFIRRDLGIKFNSAEMDLAPGPQADILLRAMQDGRIVEPLREAFFAKDGADHEALDPWVEGLVRRVHFGLNDFYGSLRVRPIRFNRLEDAAEAGEELLDIRDERDWSTLPDEVARALSRLGDALFSERFFGQTDFASWEVDRMVQAREFYRAVSASSPDVLHPADVEKLKWLEKNLDRIQRRYGSGRSARDGGSKEFTASNLNGLLREILGVRHDVKFEPRPETHPIQFIWKGSGRSSQLVRIHASVDLMDDPLGVLDKILDEARSPRNRSYLAEGRISVAFQNLNERLVALERESLPEESPDIETASDGGARDAALRGKLEQLKQAASTGGTFEVIYNFREGWEGVTLVWEDKTLRSLDGLLPELVITMPPGTSAEEIVRTVANATEASLNYSKERTILLSDDVKAPFIALAQENGVSAAADGGTKVEAPTPTMNGLKNLVRETLDPTRTHHNTLQFVPKGKVVSETHPIHFEWRGDGVESYLYAIHVWDQSSDPVAVREAILTEWKHSRHDSHRIGRYNSRFADFAKATAGWKVQINTSSTTVAPFTRSEIAALLKSFPAVASARTPVGQIAPDLETMTKAGALLVTEATLMDATWVERLKTWPKNVPVILLSRSGKWREILQEIHTISQGEQSLPINVFRAVVTPTTLLVNGRAVTLPIDFNINNAKDVIELVELETENQIVAYAVEEGLHEAYQDILGKKAYGIVYTLPEESSGEVTVGVTAFNQLLEYLSLPERDREELATIGIIEVVTPTAVEGRIGDYLRTYTETLRRL